VSSDPRVRQAVVAYYTKERARRRLDACETALEEAKRNLNQNQLAEYVNETSDEKRDG
jgi:Cdc6-like AAA superfamily ATPase